MTKSLPVVQFKCTGNIGYNYIAYNDHLIDDVKNFTTGQRVTVHVPIRFSQASSQSGFYMMLLLKFKTSSTDKYYIRYDITDPGAPYSIGTVKISQIIYDSVASSYLYIDYYYAELYGSSDGAGTFTTRDIVFLKMELLKNGSLYTVNSGFYDDQDQLIPLLSPTARSTTVFSGASYSVDRIQMYLSSMITSTFTLGQTHTLQFLPYQVVQGTAAIKYTNLPDATTTTYFFRSQFVFNVLYYFTTLPVLNRLIT